MTPHDRSSIETLSAKNDSSFPSRIDLFNALENILWFWPDLFIQSAEFGENLSEHLSLARSVRLTGTHEGFVVLRTTPGLGAMMAEKLLGPGETDSRSADAFAEFVNMFCGYLMARIREKGKASFRHFLPVNTAKKDWPTMEPNATLVVGVQDHLLEISLWTSPSTVEEPSEKP